MLENLRNFIKWQTICFILLFTFACDKVEEPINRDVETNTTETKTDEKITEDTKVAPKPGGKDTGKDDESKEGKEQDETGKEQDNEGENTEKEPNAEPTPTPKGEEDKPNEGELPNEEGKTEIVPEPKVEDYNPIVEYLYPFDQHPNIEEYVLRILVNTNRRYHYRLALPVSKSFYDHYFRSDAEVFAYWDKAEKYLNSFYNRDLGIYLSVIRDSRLIAREESVMPSYYKTEAIIRTWGTLVLNKMIGEDAYDAGVWLAKCNSYNQGQAVLGGVYKKHSKGGGVVQNSNEAVIAHELGHMFGGKHTWMDTASSQRVERGDGQSIMTHASYSDYFSLVSVADIFAYLNYYPYATDPEKKHIVDPYSLTSKEWNPLAQYNIVYAEAVDHPAPVIEVSRLKSRYKLPKKTFFSFRIPVEDPTKNMYYAANPIRKYDTEFYTNRPTKTGRVNFQEVYSIAGGLDRLSVPTDKVGVYPFRLGVSSFMPNSVPVYATYEVELEIVDAEPFVITSGVASSEYSGRKATIKWNADRRVFSSDSKVRITMSTNYGKSYEYILEEETENDGECEIALPYIETPKLAGIYPEPINPCIIKIEEIGGIAYALSNYAPRDYYGRFSGGFALSKTLNYVVFKDYPTSILHLNSESELPSPESYHIIAEKKFRNTYSSLELTYHQSETKILSDGRKYIIREWSTKDPMARHRTYAYRQYIYIKH